MVRAQDVIAQLSAALEKEPRVNPHRDRIQMAYGDGVMTLEGEVANIAAKRLTLELAAALPAVSGIVDRLHVAPAAAMGDREVADHLQRAVLQDSSFGDCDIRTRVGTEQKTIRALPADSRRGWIEIQVESGLVTLNGEVPSLSHKRLAGVLGWWVPGSRDVINGIAVEPPEADTAGEVVDAVRLALEKDGFVDAAQIRVDCQDYVVSLTGLVSSETERDMAEFDAWSVFGVDQVINQIEVRRLCQSGD